MQKWRQVVSLRQACRVEAGRYCTGWSNLARSKHGLRLNEHGFILVVSLGTLFVRSLSRSFVLVSSWRWVGNGRRNVRETNVDTHRVKENGLKPTMKRM